MTNKIYTIAVEVANEPTAVVSLNATRTAAQGPLKIIAKGGALYQLTEAATGFAPQQIQVRRRGKDLHISLEQNSPDRPDLIIENYFGVENAVVVGQAENGQHYPFIPDTARDIHAIDKLADGASITQVLGGQVGPIPVAAVAGPVEAAGAAVGVLGFNPLLLAAGGLAAAAGGGGGGGSDGGNGGGGATPSIAITSFAGDNLINGEEAPAVAINGTSTNAPNSVVKVTFTDKDGKTAEATTTTDAQGNWSIPALNLTGLADGPITAKAEVTANGTTAQDTETGSKDTFIDPNPVDPSGPGGPTGNNDWTAKLDPNSDTGTKGDGITTNNRPTFTGTGEPGGKVKITLPDGTTITANVDDNGDWTAPYPAGVPGLTSGEQRLPVNVTDPAGNTSSGELPITIEPGVEIRVFDGIQNNPPDFINAAEQSTVTVSGVATNVRGGTVEVVITDKDGNVVERKTGIAIAGDDSWTTTVDVSGAPDGQLTATAVAVSTTNVRTPESRKETVKDTFIDPNPVDPSGPGGPTGNDDWTAKLDDSSNTGPKDDNTTAINRPTLSGKGEPGGTVTVTFPDGTTSTAEVADNGTWRMPFPAATQSLPRGDVPLDVTVTDKAGNTREGELTLTIEAPAVNITTFDGAKTDPAGFINKDEVRNVTIGGTSEGAKTGDIVTIVIQGTSGDPLTVTATVQAGGAWSVSPVDLSTLPEGVLTASATVTTRVPDPLDSTQTVSVTSPADTETATKDTRIDDDNPIDPNPEQPKDWSAHIDPDSDSGTKGDGVTAVNKPLFSGKGEPGGTVEITLPSKANPNETVVVSVPVEPNGNWKLPAYPDNAAPLPNGSQDIPIKVIDPAGNSAEAKLPVTIQAPTVDITYFNGDNRPNDGFINKAEVANVTIRGDSTFAPENSVVTVRISDGSNTVTVTTTVNAEGKWTVTPSLVLLNEGTITATAVVAVASGLPSGNITSAPDTHNQVKDTVVMAPTFTDNASATNDIVLAGKSVFILDNTELNNLTSYQIGITSDALDPLTFSNLSFSRGGSLSGNTVSLTTTELNNLSQGLYTIEVRGMDQAGNTEVFQQVIGKSTGSLGAFVPTENNVATGNPNLDNYFINQKGMNEVFDLDGSGDNDKVYFLKTGLGTPGSADEATIRNFTMGKDQIVLSDILSAKTDSFLRFENVDLNGNAATLESTKIYVSTAGAFAAGDNAAALQSKADQVIYIRDFNADVNNLNWLVVI